MKKLLLSALLAASMIMFCTALAFAQVPTESYPCEAYQQQFEDENIWLTIEERIFGLSTIWRKVADMSPFLADQSEDFDWNALYIEYMTKVIDAQNMMEYYDILSRFIASLEDGKSYVQAPMY